MGEGKIPRRVRPGLPPPPTPPPLGPRAPPPRCPARPAAPPPPCPPPAARRAPPRLSRAVSLQRGEGEKGGRETRPPPPPPHRPWAIPCQGSGRACFGGGGVPQPPLWTRRDPEAIRAA